MYIYMNQQLFVGFCVVFSRARRTYNLIWRSDKDSELARLFPTLPAQPATAALEADSPYVF